MPESVGSGSDSDGARFSAVKTWPNVDDSLHNPNARNGRLELELSSDVPDPRPGADRDNNRHEVRHDQLPNSPKRRVERRPSRDQRSSATRSRRSTQFNSRSRNGPPEEPELNGSKTQHHHHSHHNHHNHNHHHQHHHNPTSSSTRPDDTDGSSHRQQQIDQDGSGGSGAAETNNKNNNSSTSGSSSTRTSTRTSNHNNSRTGSGMEKLAIGTSPRHRGLGAPPYRPKSPWHLSIRTLMATVAGLICLALIVYSLNAYQLDPKGCRMAWMHPSYHRFTDFDTEHTRFASKYSLYLYRDSAVERDRKLRGIPVIFIPGNAGSYKQVRSFASEAANHFHHVVRHDREALRNGARPLDFFSVDFNEDFTAFHGRTLLDQAEYLNEAVRYILSLYLDPRTSEREPGMPDPTSVIVIGHSMGGMVARAMLTMPNYQASSINTILTMSAPHTRAPVSFDGLMVRTYSQVNDYWRRAYSQRFPTTNPLDQVTLISVAGGNLDTIVPSDYASIESLVPPTHGFTVYTSTIPNVWTSMDHQAITWCDQFRKVVSYALYDVVDIHRASQTKPRAERMRRFRRWFLTGMEHDAPKALAQAEASTLLILNNSSDGISRQGERLVLRGLGSAARGRLSAAHLLPIPPPGSPAGKRLTIMTDQPLALDGEQSQVQVLFCSMMASWQSVQVGAAPNFENILDLSGDGSGPTRLACKSAPASDMIQLPRSTRSTIYPFYLDDEPRLLPFSYLQYDVDEIAADHQFVAVVDKALHPTAGFVVAEFTDLAQSHSVLHVSLRQLVTRGLDLHLPSSRPMVTELKVPSLKSSLLAYNLEITKHRCVGGDDQELFAPLVRQYLTEPHESKYYVNAHHASISLHGVAPYMPPPLRPRADGEEGIGFQFWTDPTCRSELRVRLTVDVLGSMGKLYMRYRTIFACFPLLIVALALREQFRLYDGTGVFVPFNEGLDLALRRSIPMLLAGLTVFSMAAAGRRRGDPIATSSHDQRHNSTAPPTVDFYENDLLTGTGDPFFWFMVPLIGLVCTGACTALNLTVLGLTQLLSSAFGLFKVRFAWRNRHDGNRQGSPTLPSPKTSFRVCSPRRRVITTAILVFFVAALVPYQFAYIVCCVVQLTTTVRALRIMSDAKQAVSPSSATASEKYTSNNTNHHNENFFNYVHSILILMIWVMPIDLPVLFVWIRNLALNWMTPFSSHHNVLSIIPFIVLVETHTTGKMVPRVTSRALRHVSGALLLIAAVYAAVYGVSYAFVLHHLFNIFAAWLVAVHLTTAAAAVTGSGSSSSSSSGGGGNVNGAGFASFSSSSWSTASVSSLFENGHPIAQKRGKIP